MKGRRGEKSEEKNKRVLERKEEGEEDLRA